MYRALQKYRLKCIFNLLIIILLTGCTNEIEVKKSASDIIYEPYGTGSEVTNSFAINEHQTLVVFNYTSLALLEDDMASIKWHNADFDEILSVTPIGERGFLVMEQFWDSGIRGLGFKVINHKGEIVFRTTPGLKLFPDKPNLTETLIGCVSDGGNGAYLTFLLVTESQLPTERHLLHINENNEFDLQVRIPTFCVYVASDNKGDLYMIRTISPEGAAVMQLQAFKLKMSELKVNRVVTEWTYGFYSLEPDWKWASYFPFKFEFSHNRLHIIKQHNTGADDLSTGIDVIILNPENGNETNSFTIDFNTEIDNYRNQSTFKAVYSEDHIGIVYNFGFKSKYTKTMLDGTVIKDIALAGKNARAKFRGIGYSGNRLVIHGLSTLIKSPYTVPFIYKFDK